MTASALRQELEGDLTRFGDPTWLLALRCWALYPSYRFLVVFRLAGHCWRRGRWTPLALLTRLVHRRMSIRYGYEIPVSTSIGPGLHISHLGPVIINYRATIGANVNIASGVVVGRANGGSRPGVPAVGDGVLLGPGAKVLGAVTIGDDAAVGANAVVLHDVASGCTVAGAPARQVSDRGSESYVRHRYVGGGSPARP